MGALAKLWTDASVYNHSMYLIFLAIPINMILWGCEIWALRKSLLEKLEVFLQHSIRTILGISITAVKYQRITNETLRRKFFVYSISRKNCNTTANIHWESDTQLWRPYSQQTSHCMVQPQEKNLDVYCTRTKNPLSTTLVSSYQEWEKPEHSKHRRTFPSMTYTGNT